MTYEERPVTWDLVRPMVEQPEPALYGDWFTVDLEGLRLAGWTHIMFHFPDGVDTDASPNEVSLIKNPDPKEG
jgi:hypothetical protein